MASIFKESANQAIESQPVYLRYKGSILIVLSGLAWVLTELASSQDIADLGWSGAIGVAATVVAFFVNRFTKDGITPSMARRLEDAGMQAFLDRPSETGVAVDEPVGAVYDVPDVGEGEIELPTYRGDSTAD